MRRPAAVLRRVVAVVVDAIQFLSLWAMPHIGIEVIELLPYGADLNPAPAIIRVLGILWITASLRHRPPSAIGFRHAQAVSAVTHFFNIPK